MEVMKNYLGTIRKKKKWIRGWAQGGGNELLPFLDVLTWQSENKDDGMKN